MKMMVDRVEECLSGMDDNEVIGLWNRYTEEAGYMDDEIYPMDEFDELMDGYKPHDLARTIFYGDFCPAHDWFWFNGYANLESSDFPISDKKSPVDTRTMANWIVDNDDDLDSDDIREILDDLDDPDDE